MSPEDETARPASRPSGRSSTIRRVVVGVLLVWLVVGVVAAVVVGQRLVSLGAAPDPFSDARASDARERAAAAAVAEQFTLRMDNVDGTKFDDYVAGISEMLTTKAKAENKQSLEALKESYQTAKVKGTGKVLVTGVASLSDDAASVLVAHDANVSTTQGDIEHHYRWTVDLVKVDGDWRVDGFTPVN